MSLWNPTSHQYIPHKGGYTDEESFIETLSIGKDIGRQCLLIIPKRKIDFRAPLKTIVSQMRRQIFRQIVLKFRRHTGVCQEILVQNDGKYASR